MPTVWRHGDGMQDIPVILLAAGQSRRMRGIDKLMQEVDGQPLLRRSVSVAQAAGPVFVALPPRPHARYDVLSDLDVNTIPIADADEGMNASLRGALSHIDRSVPAVMVLLADLPEITRADVQAVRQAVENHGDCLIWRGATSAGKPGHPVVFERELFPQLLKLTGDQGAQSVVRANSSKTHLVTLPGDHALLDLDTPEAWADWRAKSTP